MNRLWLLGSLATLSVGCGTGAVRELTKAEQEYLVAVEKRADSHRSTVESLLSDLRSLERQFAFAERQNTTTAVAQAKLLESMQAPWAAPSASLETTQRAVILFHLYELLGQEKALFEAKQEERDSERQRAMDKYDELVQLLKDALEDEKIVLQYANQPDGSQIAAILEQTLAEARAASSPLAKSTDPRVQKLASETEKIADQVAKTKESIQDALNAIKSLKK